MATKNLARTVIEGGRSPRSKFERRYSNRQARRRSRAFAHRTLRDPDLADESAAAGRPAVGRFHDDRLGAAGRWLVTAEELVYWSELTDDLQAVLSRE